MLRADLTNAWGIETEKPRTNHFAPVDGSLRAIRDVQIPVAILSIGLTITGIYVPGAPGDLPIGQLSAILLVLLALTRRNPRRLGGMGWILALALVMGAYLVLVSATSPFAATALWTRRLFRLFINVSLLFAIVSDRIHLRSVMIGVGTGMAVNVPLFWAGVVPRPYGTDLSGIFGDKNQAGLWYCVMGLLLLGLIRSNVARTVAIVVLAVTLFTTGSRTSMGGFAAGLIWILVSGRLPSVLRWLVAIGISRGIDFLEQNYARSGSFADRLGSDLLRERIDAAAQIKVNQIPFLGQGLGEATVNIQDKDWFFHNSYWSLQVEGGWPYLVVVLAVTIWLGIRPFRDHAADWTSRCIEAAVLGMLVCGFRLGEVFLTVVWCVVMAAAMSQRRDEEEAREQERLEKQLTRERRNVARAKAS